MTGAGFRTFSAGAILAGTAVQDFLMDQAVMNFAGTAARGSALPSPSEGMVAHVGGGTVTVYNGTAWANLGGSFPWQTYTPTLTGLTVGNGTMAARYVQIGKFVAVYVKITWGSTTSLSGSMTMSNPVTAGTAPPSGEALFTDTSNGPNIVLGTISTGAEPRVPNVAATYPNLAQISGTVPFTWANTDVMEYSWSYEAA